MNPRSGYSAKEMEAQHIANLLTQPMRVSCAKCAWSLEGIGKDVVREQQAHRRTHGDTKKLSRRAYRNLSSFRSPDLTEEDVAEIAAEVAMRRRLHGLEDAA